VWLLGLILSCVVFWVVLACGFSWAFGWDTRCLGVTSFDLFTNTKTANIDIESTVVSKTRYHLRLTALLCPCSPTYATERNEGDGREVRRADVVARFELASLA
jgi:hypothetical protein